MSENSEQSNIPKQEPLLGVPAEFVEQEQELSLEQQGRQLAAQIKDMHAKAETKEELAAVQAKIAELRKMFEVEEKETGEKVYRDFDEVVEPVKRFLFMKGLNPVEQLSWTFWETSGKTFIELGDIDNVDADMKFDSPAPKEAERRFSNALTGLSSGKGFQTLKNKLDNRKVRSYVIDGTWLLEAEPQQKNEGRDLMDIMNQIDEVYKSNGLAKNGISSSMTFDVYENGIILANLSSTSLSGRFQFDQTESPEKEDELNNLIKSGKIVYNGIDIDELNEAISNKKVRVYDVENKLTFEVVRPEIPNRSIRSLVEQILEELNPRGLVVVNLDNFHWELNDKYISTGLLVSKSALLKSRVIQEPNEDELNDLTGVFKFWQGNDFDGLAIKIGGPNIKAKAFVFHGQLYIKLVD